MVNRRRILVPESLRRLIESIPIVSGSSLLASRFARAREIDPAVRVESGFPGRRTLRRWWWRDGPGVTRRSRWSRWSRWLRHSLPSDRKEQRKNFHVWTHKIIRTAADFIRELSCTHGSASRKACALQPDGPRRDFGPSIAPISSLQSSFFHSVRGSTRGIRDYHLRTYQKKYAFSTGGQDGIKIHPAGSSRLPHSSLNLKRERESGAQRGADDPLRSIDPNIFKLVVVVVNMRE